jgi:hypothetical protein
MSMLLGAGRVKKVQARKYARKNTLLARREKKNKEIMITKFQRGNKSSSPKKGNLNIIQFKKRSN